MLTDPIKPSFLDAGSPLMITGPGGAKTVNATSTGYFSSTLASAAPFYIAPEITWLQTAPAPPAWQPSTGP